MSVLHVCVHGNAFVQCRLCVRTMAPHCPPRQHKFGLPMYCSLCVIMYLCVWWFYGGHICYGGGRVVMRLDLSIQG